ncbi:hypothetical protein CIK05_06920 [Bdellovibrio sp. qaytius]|nr:hypothetical protein CIK05_06920 [Bdellovibrio sp. qaytius]
MSYFGTTIVFAAPSCEVLFSESKSAEATTIVAEAEPLPVIKESVQSQSPRVELVKVTNSPAPEKLVIENVNFSEKTDEAAIEVMRLLLQNSSYVLEEKNVLNKGELVIGIPAKDGYYFEVTYKSMSGERSQFIVDKISLKTPTGSESKKIAEGFLKAGELKLKKSEFEIGNLLGDGINAKLKIPLIIDGPLLNKIDKLARFFEFFKKDEMRNLLKSNSMLKIRTVFEYRRARDVFFKVLLKEPMKAAIGLGFIVLATSVSNMPMNVLGRGPEPIGNQVAAMAPRETISFLQSRINQMNIPSAEVNIKAEISQLNAQIKTHFSSNAAYNGPKLSEIRLDQESSFSLMHQTFIIEKADEFNKSVHTYIVFAEEKASTVGPGVQYMIMEINPSKYPLLIKLIKGQTSISGPTAAAAEKAG